MGLRVDKRTFLFMISLTTLLVLCFYSASVGQARLKVVPLGAIDSTRATNSYILSLSYDEQLSNALKNFLQLGQLANDISARLVIPFVHSSRLYGIPNFIPSVSPEDDAKIFPLTDVLDVVGLTDFCFGGAFIPESFLQFTGYSARNIVVVYVVKAHSLLGGAGVKRKLHLDLIDQKIRHQLLQCTGNNRQPSYCFCKSFLNPFLSKLQKALNELSPTNPFHVIDAVCIHIKKMVHFQSLFDEIKEKTGKRDISLVIPDWNGMACSSHGNCYTNMRSHFLTKDSLKSHCNDSVKGIQGRYNLFHQFFPKKIHKLAKRFMIDQGITEKTVILGAHIRMERMGRQFAEIECCMNAFLDVLKSTSHQLGSSHTKVLLVTDTGSYGTQTCSINCANVTRYVMNGLDKHNLVPVHFDPVSYKVKESPTFVALIELLALAHSTELIYMGSGSAFQRNILGNALQIGKVKHVHIVCSEENPSNHSRSDKFALFHNECKNVTQVNS